MLYKLAVLFFLLTFPVWLGAQTLNQTDWTQGYMLKGAPLSFGGAFRAVADTNATILYNPAGIISKKDRVSVGADYVRNGATDSNVFSGSVIDSQALEYVALGFSYDRDDPSIAGSRATVQQFTLAAAAGGDIISFGGSVKGYLSSTSSPFLESPNSVDIDVGALVKPIPMLALAVTGQNLIQGSKYQEFPTILGFGTALTLEPHARIAIDVTRNFNTPSNSSWNAYFGAELRAVEGVFIRGGFGLDKVQNNNFYSVAGVLAAPKISLLFTFAQRLNPVNELFAGNIELYF